MSVEADQSVVGAMNRPLQEVYFIGSEFFRTAHMCMSLLYAAQLCIESANTLDRSSRLFRLIVMHVDDYLLTQFGDCLMQDALYFIGIRQFVVRLNVTWLLLHSLLQEATSIVMMYGKLPGGGNNFVIRRRRLIYSS